MRFLDDNEAAVLAAVAALADGNPFLPDRVEAERRALGADFERTSAVWHAEAELAGTHPNLPRLRERVEALAPLLRERLAAGAKVRKAELVQYEALVRHLLYMRYENDWFALIAASERGDDTTGRVASYRRFAKELAHFCEIPGVKLPVASPPAHLFAWGFQIRRAFHHTYRRIYGGSMPAARLRAAVWQSIFTRDVQRYRRGLYQRMGDFPTLVTGPSGTGKELVARAIGLSRYVPFDERSQSFAHDFAASFHAVNLSALSPTLIESELFGHRRGAFTGAVEDRPGWLETCGPQGTVFLDEIGELDGAIQVKLLRVLQTRTFQRIGETSERRFEGKIIAATNRDLAAEMRAGRFREDFYYRLCADLVTAPSLREQLAGEGAEQELANLLLVIARRVAGEEEGAELAREAGRWIAEQLGPHYPWPGNVRELEQCLRNVLIRGEYLPPDVADEPAVDDLAAALAAGELSAEDLVRSYCTHVYAAVGSYEEAARRLGLDRRTVKAKVDRELLERLKRGRCS